jgi:hypothetical protein
MKTYKTLLMTFFLIIMLIASISQVNAQRIELSPFIGYETGAYVSTNLGRLHINDGMDFGGSLDIGIGVGRYAELSYSQMYTSFNLESGVASTKLSNLVVDYYSAGILQEIKPGAKVTPYGLVTLGLVNYRPSEKYSNENKMHISLAGGIKIRATERIGLRLQARLLMPIYYAGTYFTIGSGGTGYGISGGVVAVQGDFTAALVFTFK